MKEILPWLVRWACHALATLVGPVQFFFLLSLDYFTSFVSIAKQAGQWACNRCVACLFMCLYPIFN
jgi:hypothetical protein